MNAKAQEITSEIEILKEEIEELICERDSIELDPDDYIDEYDEYLAEKENVIIAGVSYDVSTLKDNHEIYTCGLNDYVITRFDVSDTEEFIDCTQEIETRELELIDLEEQELLYMDDEDEDE